LGKQDQQQNAPVQDLPPIRGHLDYRKRTLKQRYEDHSGENRNQVAAATCYTGAAKNDSRDGR
jgi:hypothetical protein